MTSRNHFPASARALWRRRYIQACWRSPDCLMSVAAFSPRPWDGQGRKKGSSCKPGCLCCRSASYAPARSREALTPCVDLEQDLGLPDVQQAGEPRSSVGVCKTIRGTTGGCPCVLGAIDARLSLRRGSMRRELECAILAMTAPQARIVGKSYRARESTISASRGSQQRLEFRLLYPRPRQGGSTHRCPGLRTHRRIRLARVDSSLGEGGGTGTIWLNEINTCRFTPISCRETVGGSGLGFRTHSQPGAAWLKACERTALRVSG